MAIVNFNVKVDFDPNKISQFQIQIDNAINGLQSSLVQIGNEGARHMQETIKAETYRKPSTGTLAKAIQAETVETPFFFVGIGRISKLPPYWYVLNYGRTFSGSDFYPGRLDGATNSKTVLGSFGGQAPNPANRGTTIGAGKSRFNKDGKFAVTSEHPIKPKNYIEKTLFWLSTNWKTMLSRK